MKVKNRQPILCAFLTALFMMSCMLPGMIPLKSQPKGPIPVMEKDPDALIKALSGKNWQYLQAFASEQYTPEDYAKPGTLTFTVNITENMPIYFNYGWCAADEKTLQQNMEHIHVKLYFNDQELGKDVVHPLTYTQNNQPCADYGVLMSDWPEGKYTLKAVANFDEKLNDGMADYDAGDYVFVYNVTVKQQQKEGTATTAWRQTAPQF